MGVKRDCYFFGESNVGPMNVPICGNGGSFSSMMFSCEGCKNYIRKSEVTEFVRFMLKFRKTSEEYAEAFETGFTEQAKKAGDAIRRMAQVLNHGSQTKESEDEEISEVERENDRYNQEQDWLENHGRELE